MAMLFLGDGSTQESGMARRLLSGCAASHPEVYNDVKSRFHALRVANGVEEPSSLKQLEELRADLDKAVQEILGKGS